MKILITGTNGFVGRNLKEYFEERYDDLECPKRDRLNLLDPEAVLKYLSRKTYDIVIHSGVTLHSSEENLKMYFNIEKCAPLFGKLICIGSGAEFDGANYVPKMKEDYFGRFVPTDVYGFSKYVIAKDIESIRRNIYNLRVFGIFGKYEDYKRRFISNNICRVLSGMDLTLNSNMNFDYIYVKDFVKIVDLFITRDPKHRTYNICRGESIDLLTLAKIIKDVDGGGDETRIIVKNEAIKPEYTGDNSRFQTEFGPYKFVKFKDSVKELYDWYKYKSGLTFSEATLE
jgi:GDP-L-fucose synthase